MFNKVVLVGAIETEIEQALLATGFPQIKTILINAIVYLQQQLQNGRISMMR